MPRSTLLLALLCATGAPSAPVRAQIPDEFQNLQVLPDDISRDGLLTVMRNFSFALGVRCQYCHVGGDGISFEGVEFHKDDDPDKRKARFMLRLVSNMNQQVLPLIPDRDDPAVRIECKTCHRGQPKPLLLKQEMRLALQEFNVDSAVVRYRQLREQFPMSGAFDFGEWEVNTLAEDLAQAGRPRDAIAIYELNAQYFSESTSIHFSLGRLYEEVGDNEAAIRSYERVLELRPNHAPSQRRLEALRGD